MKTNAPRHTGSTRRRRLLMRTAAPAVGGREPDPAQAVSTKTGATVTPVSRST